MSANYSRAAEVPIEDPSESATATPTPTPSQAVPWVPWVMPEPTGPAPLAPGRRPSTRPQVLVAPVLGVVRDFTPPPPLAIVSEAAVIAEPSVVAEAAVVAGAAVVEAPARPQPTVLDPVPARRTAPEKRKLTPAERFRIWIGRPLLAGIAFASLFAVGLPVIGATYTRDSANPLAWRNLSFGEVQGKLQYCFAGSRLPGSAVWCDYGHAIEAGGLAPKKGRIKKTFIQVPYPVAGPIIYDQAPAQPSGGGPAAGPQAGGGAPTRAGGQPVPMAGNGPFPVIHFPAGPMAAIEAACESAKQAAQGQSAAYQQNVERQCEAAKQAYERAHP
jgi:hypothetical protein